MNTDHLKRSLDNLDPIFDALAKKYGDHGASTILQTKMMIYAIGTNESHQEILNIADKVALFNDIKIVGS